MPKYEMIYKYTISNEVSVVVEADSIDKAKPIALGEVDVSISPVEVLDSLVFVEARELGGGD